jgi:hypothetical protein
MKHTDSVNHNINNIANSLQFQVSEASSFKNRIHELNSVFGLEKLDRWDPIRTPAIQSRSCPIRVLGFSNHEKGAQRQEISK